MVLPGGSQRCQVSVSISNKRETNCQLPFTRKTEEASGIAFISKTI